jgi:hypothetical protein
MRPPLPVFAHEDESHFSPRMIGSPVLVLPMTTTFVLVLPASFSVASMPFHSNRSLLAARRRQLGDAFTMKRFMDEFNAAGLIPASLLRWELTGQLPDDIAQMLGMSEAKH